MADWIPDKCRPRPLPGAVYRLSLRPAGAIPQPRVAAIAATEHDHDPVVRIVGKCRPRPPRRILVPGSRRAGYVSFWMQRPLMAAPRPGVVRGVAAIGETSEQHDLLRRGVICEAGLTRPGSRGDLRESAGGR